VFVSVLCWIRKPLPFCSTCLTVRTLPPLSNPRLKDNGGVDHAHPTAGEPFLFGGMSLGPGVGGTAQVTEIEENSQAERLNVLPGSTVLAVNSIALSRSNVSSVRDLLLAQVRNLSEEHDQSMISRFNKLATATGAAVVSAPKTVEITVRFNRHPGSSIPRYLRFDILELVTASEPLKCCIAGIVACSLPQDDGCHGQWCLQFLRTLVVKILNLSEGKIAAYEPLLWAFSEQKSAPEPFVENVIGDENRKVLLKDLFVLSCSTLGYDARCRSMLRAVAKSLEVDWKNTFSQMEMSLGASLTKEMSNIHQFKHEKKKMTVRSLPRFF
jgi:hypothetical protein